MGRMEETTFFVNSLAEKNQESAGYAAAGYRIMLFSCFVSERYLTIEIFKIATVTSIIEELQYINNKKNTSCVISFVQKQLCIYEEKNSSAFVILCNVGSRSFG